MAEGQTAFMPNYTFWNKAIVEYFTQSAPMGSKVYLSLSEDVLELIASSWDVETDRESWVEDFRKAVRNRVVKDNY